MWCILVVMLVLRLALGQQVESGCEDWYKEPRSSNDVCCNRCKPGNRLVNHCGADPKALCEVCENGTYITDGNQKMCQRCRVCTAPMRVKQACTFSSDTVCECDQGLRCGDDQCSYCIQECGKGEEPSDKRGCRPCPEGTFNSEIHHVCVKWSSSCSSPDQKIIAQGTAVSDIVCGPKADPKPITPAAKPTKIQPDSIDISPWTTMGIAIICAFLILFIAMILITGIVCKNGEKLKTAPEHEKAPLGWMQTPESEQCSYCSPQEEEGSSSDLSLVSVDKPFELVV
ncbi:tumor necrosis factor receptor superfamily member 9 [Astyanax mexicanus]|uniref:TNF receptor superfamily member 9 n=1 Tax=Astyanax mexicanus TaxID=7994 RepID=A0A8B9H1B1_ASTMX|nr:tumor necrosis factor receptor superfamily member 9 [Astyanax mexicanus]